jgi:hypothetical protein
MNSYGACRGSDGKRDPLYLGGSRAPPTAWKTSSGYERYSVQIAQDHN